MLTIDIRACVIAIEEVRANAAAKQEKARQEGENIAQRILEKLPSALRDMGPEIRVIHDETYRPHEVVAAALLALKDASGVSWWEESGWYGTSVFCCLREDLKRRLLSTKSGTARRRRERA